MIREALEFLVHDVGTPVLVKPWAPFGVDLQAATSELHLPPSLQPKTVEVSTLSSVVSYLAANRDELERKTLSVVVGSPVAVSILGIPDPYGRRPVFVTAKAETPSIVLDRFLGRETFHIQLLAMFEPGTDRDELLRLIGNLEAGEIRTVEDDGVSQQVVVKANLATKARETVRPIFRLAPYSSFTEVAQVERPFLLRLRDGSQGVECALFEADGGAWRIEARRRVAQRLTEGLTETSIPVLF